MISLNRMESIKICLYFGPLYLSLDMPIFWTTIPEFRFAYI